MSDSHPGGLQSPPSRGDSATPMSHGSTGSQVPLPRYPDNGGREAGYRDRDPDVEGGLNINDSHHDNDEPPPEYSATDPSNGFPAAEDSSAYPSSLPTHGPGYPLQPFSHSADSSTIYYLDPRLDKDAAFLEQHIASLAVEPPRPFVRIRGHHQEHKKSGERKDSRQIVDFDVQIELTPLLYEDAALRRDWHRLEAVKNFDKVRRGTVFPKRAPGFGGNGTPEDGTPRIDQWCRRYCEKRAALKAFTLERRIVGWDFSLIGGQLESLVRSTNYQGHLNVTFPTIDSRVQIYNDCRANRWRLTRWIELLFYFTFLWIFSWPVLAFRTKWFETVYVEWPMGVPDQRGTMQYPCMSEEQWYKLWCRPIQQAVLTRRQATLYQADLDNSFAPGAEDFVRGIQAGLQVVQQTLGWGADTESGDSHHHCNTGRR
ncbi:hypothetical protein B0J13DRAFT_299919 [Dactylonectria estremocensis]|uniref:Uncharacterized protein n=1 Tax=Dactylonectria estremocensis TaxID=1079267 RepID=A0A9P9JAL4_9HYPO|nr:hypothetical protein B0J13DRAFT_299919 [Dactylonectria estremocensis]